MLGLLGIGSLDSFFAVVVALLVGVLITAISGIVIAAFLIFLAIRAGPSILGAFARSEKFMPVVSVISIIVPTAASLFSAGPLAAVGTGVGATFSVICAYLTLRESQEARRKDRPSENAAPMRCSHGLSSGLTEIF